MRYFLFLDHEMNKQIFETKGLKDSFAGPMLILVMVVAVTLLIVSFAVDGKFVGPWWIYAAALVATIFGFRLLGKINATVFLLTQNEKGIVSIEVQGKKLQRNFVVGDYTYWQYTKYNGPKYGSTLHLVVAITSDSGRIVLNLTDNRVPGQEAVAWPIISRELSLSEESFMVDNIEGLVVALDKATAKGR